MTETKRSLLFALSFSASFGCAGNDLPDDRVWESAHFRYHTRKADHQACSSVLGRLEQHLGLVQGFLGFPWSAGRKVDYYKFPSAAELASSGQCSKPDRSCTVGGQVMSADVLRAHELIHAYLAPLGRPPDFFSEGIAVVLACGDPFSIKPSVWRDVIASGGEDAYSVGPWFVGYLLDTYGPEPFLKLYGALRETDSADTIASTFARVYGQALDDAWNAAASAGGAVRCKFLWECAGPALDIDGASESIAESCDGAGAFKTFEATSAADLVLGTSSGLVHAPVSCASGAAIADTSDGDDAAWFTTVSHLDPGRYFIGNVDIASRVALTLGSSPWLAPACGEVTPLPLELPQFVRSEFTVIVPTDGQRWFVSTPPSGSLDACPLGPNEHVSVAECASCAASALCAEPACLAPGSETSGADATYRIAPDATETGYVEVIFSFVE